MTTIQILLHYISYCVSANQLIASHHIELTAPEFGKEQFDVQHNPGTYSRKFRNIREKAVEYGLSFEKILNPKDNENLWKISVIDPIKFEQQKKGNK
jgi:hypothetical protein